jgi:hypothetical protein
MARHEHELEPRNPANRVAMQRIGIAFFIILALILWAVLERHAGA